MSCEADGKTMTQPLKQEIRALKQAHVASLVKDDILPAVQNEIAHWAGELIAKIETDIVVDDKETTAEVFNAFYIALNKETFAQLKKDISRAS